MDKKVESRTWNSKLDRKLWNPESTGLNSCWNDQTAEREESVDFSDSWVIISNQARSPEERLQDQEIISKLRKEDRQAQRERNHISFLWRKQKVNKSHRGKEQTVKRYKKVLTVMESEKGNLCVVIMSF